MLSYDNDIGDFVCTCDISDISDDRSASGS